MAQGAFNTMGCLRLCKDTKIKANHNFCCRIVLQVSLSKTLQRYENKSKSQLPMRILSLPYRCLRLCKDTKIKANHNKWHTTYLIEVLSKTLQRYENKSKSQRKDLRDEEKKSCLRLCKDTKIKANHNK